MVNTISSNKNIRAAILATAVVRLQINDQICPPLRALCDTGSQINIINASSVQKLQWPTHRCNIQMNSISSIKDKTYTRKIICKLLSRFNNEPLATIELIIVPQITTVLLPQSPIPAQIIPQALRDQLADLEAHTPAPIDVLLGAGVWAIIIQDGSFANDSNIAFQPSRLGWLIFGGGNQTQKQITMNMATSSASDLQLDKILQRFWEGEEVSLVRTRTTEQEQCEEIFMRTHRRLDNGRIQVNIPLRSDIRELGSSRTIALHRFLQLEKRFRRDEEFKTKYFNAIQELLSSDQMRIANRPPGPLCYHIPHHAVLKKFRVVYDASCPTDRGLSLNNAQLIGEKLQEDLAPLIMRFRCHPVAVTADIKKMYLQVRINPSQWDLQRIFWRAADSSEIQEYWLTTVTFGLASAPHCAVRAMIQAARESRTQWPMGAEAVERDFYMDDCLTGAADWATAKQLCHEMDALLQSYGFILSKWRSNHAGVVPHDKNEQADDALDLGELNDTTVLGLRWLPSTDELMFKFQSPPILKAKEATKRRVLCHIAQIFDPNGYVGPVVIVAKIIMQDIWRANIGWDAPVPDDIYRRWQQFQQQLPLIANIRFPRWLGICEDRNISLHGFADASLTAYGAVLYMRIETTDHVETVLIAAKSHVAPVKSITIPRLELCAAKLLSELYFSFISTTKLAHVNTTLWSDSQIVLAWLLKDPAKLKIFVNNRIQKIQRLTSDSHWRYVPSGDNPADLLSRGISAAELCTTKLWWHGPEWLLRQDIHWPETEPKRLTEIEEDIKQEEKSGICSHNGKLRKSFKALLIMNITLRDVDLLSRTSNAIALSRLTAWIFRFQGNSRRKEKNLRQCGPLTNAEVERGLEYWIRAEQAIYYESEITTLRKLSTSGVDKSSSILKFNPQLDERGLLRMSGRLDRSLLSNDRKNPVILPDISPLSKLLIQEAHAATLHGGPREMGAYIRRKYWITNLRRAIHTHNSRCIVCVRENQQAMQQMMGELPSDRVQPCRPFRHSGVDYAGPFLLKARGGRCNIFEKKYVAVFVCMVTKAVHLELVDSLSTADFIQAFVCFTSIRGACTHLWSDNGTNFTGAEKELARMLRTWKGMDMAKELQEYGTEWRFITPSAPHQGGLWEAAVKSMKYHLKRIVGPHKLTSSAFRVILAQTSAVMNSRPLSAQSDDPEDLSFLTPAHFLIGEPIIQPFGANLQEVPHNKLKLAAQIQKMTQSLWKVWSKDYLHELQQRPKWQKSQPNLKKGDLVLLREENLPPTLWKTARVIEVFPGSDGLVRNARLRVATSDLMPGQKTKKDLLERPVQKLCKLPLDVEA